MVNVRQLAEFIDSPGEDEQHPDVASTPPAAASNRKGRASRDEASKAVRPPPMSKALLALRRGLDQIAEQLEQIRAEMDLMHAVMAEMEARAFEEVVPKAKKSGRGPQRV